MRARPPADAVHVVAAVLRNRDREVLLTRRPEGAHQGGLWEFPGGKVERGEAVETALRRELAEELGVTCRTACPLITVSHRYSDKHVWLDVWELTDWTGTPTGREGQPLQWVRPDVLHEVAMPAADVPVITALALPSTYVVTPEPDGSPGMFLRHLRGSLDDGATLIQLRVKSLSERDYLALAREVIGSAAASRCRVLLNADPAMVERLGADGVHLNSGRLHDFTARPLPRSKLVAVSCHNAEDLRQARRIEADFAVLGPVNSTTSHPDWAPLGWEGFSFMAVAAGLPVYAIGGMARVDVPIARRAGGQGIAAIRSLWGGGLGGRASVGGGDTAVNCG
ncbi:MAG: Thiamine-phosphate synthase [Gammaproteobacteria bacterium]|nr:Thiamine-phosphate synthase [Gammaproteobacteria bacterium]